MISYYATIVTLSVKRTVFFRNSTSKNAVILKTGLRSLKMSPLDTEPMTFY